MTERFLVEKTQLWRFAGKSAALPSLRYCINNRGRTHSFEMRYSSRPSQVSASHQEARVLSGWAACTLAATAAGT